MKLKNNKQIFTLKELFQEVYDYIINTKEIDNDLFCIYHDVFFTWLKDIKLKIDNIKIEEEIFFNKYELYTFYQVLILAMEEKHNISIYDVKNSKSFQKKIQELGIFNNLT